MLISAFTNALLKLQVFFNIGKCNVNQHEQTMNNCIFINQH